MTKKKSKFKVVCVLVLAFCALIWFVLEKCHIFSTKQLYNVFGLQEFCTAADDYPVAIHFINVGCGDSILISCNNHYALIDTGEYTLDSTTVDYLKKCGITKLDLVVGTHPDSDHIGDMVSVVENFDVDTYWLGYTSEPKVEPYNSVLNAILKTKSKLDTPFCGEEFHLNDMTLTVLSPSKIYNTDNNNSIVICAEYKSVSFLFMADAEKEVETDLLERCPQKLPSTVLKLGHHGSKTSTTQPFFDVVQPQYTIISAGEQNKNLPSRETVERISQTEICRTDFDGTVITATDGENIFIFKENEQ